MIIISELSIEATVPDIGYSPTMARELTSYSYEDITNGSALQNASFVLEDNVTPLAVSTWVTPKRTRSYPFSRVYDTIQYPYRATILPIVKDEGADGDRDYLQWDTVSLMNLLNVYFIPAYYSTAERNTDYDNKITNQQFDTEYILEKLRQLQEHQSGPLTWNLRELKNLDYVAERCKHCYYDKIPSKTGVDMNSEDYFDRNIDNMISDIKTFMNTSRKSAQMAQISESSSVQPDENVMNDKGKITIIDSIGGEYHFTVDEAIKMGDDTLVLLEKKHTSSSTLPSENDIKDGLLKLMLYTNIAELVSQETQFDVVSGLGLTGNGLQEIYTPTTPTDTLEESDLSELFVDRLKAVFTESEENGFIVFAAPGGITEKEQRNVLQELLNEKKY